MLDINGCLIIRVMCTQCNSIFDESYVKVNDNDNEYCPICNGFGYLMDIKGDDE